jgi:hypothetical protein
MHLANLTELLREQGFTMTEEQREALRGAIALFDQASDEELAIAEAAVDLNCTLPIDWANKFDS